MTNEEAAKCIERIRFYMEGGECWADAEFEAMDMAIEALRSVSSTGMSDLIDRQAAIDAVVAVARTVDSYYFESERIIHEADAVEAISMLPSAQPDKRTEERAKMHACDLISRSAAIEALEQYPFEKVVNCLSILEELPSAQPEIIHCRECKHWKKTYGVKGWSVGDCDVFDTKLVMCEGFCAWAERREE